MLQLNRFSLQMMNTYRCNDIDTKEWATLMDELASVTSIRSFNGVAGLRELFAGGRTTVDLEMRNLAENEAVVAVSRLLLRSAKTLISLNMR